MQDILNQLITSIFVDFGMFLILNGYGLNILVPLQRN
jgi:hypothetical protein